MPPHERPIEEASALPRGSGLRRRGDRDRNGGSCTDPAPSPPSPSVCTKDEAGGEGERAHPPSSPPSPPSTSSSVEDEADNRVVMEFGGPIGVTFLMALFPSLMAYIHICLLRHSGVAVSPLDAEFWRDGLPHLAPTRYAASLYLGFTLWEGVTAYALPGILMKGLPVPSLGGRQLEYNCNGVASWYLDLIVLTVAHVSGTFDVADVLDNVAPIMSVGILFSFAVSVSAYCASVRGGTAHRMSGSIAYDFFMGAGLNPRIGDLDLKMFSEIRIPWKILFLITLSSAVKDHRINAEAAAELGLPTHMDLLGSLLPVSLPIPIVRTSTPLLFMLLAHTLYTNACMKGEECIPTTWDIVYEKWGFMLIYWNLAGVPFSYCYSTLYLMGRSSSGRPVSHSTPYTVALFGTLLVAYYVWDTANSQKNRFRMQQRGTYVRRHAFPQLPWGTLSDPSYIVTSHGNKLLTGGWWGTARKIHYTADLTMALTWGLIAGPDSPIPYFYFCFFLTVLSHRVSRDMRHCGEKYGKDWDEYTRVVPYIFVPGVF